MGYKIGVLTLHGMGNQEENYYRTWKKNIRRELSAQAKRAVVFEAVYYQDIMQKHQTRLWENRLDWQTKSLCPLVLVVAFGIAVWVAALATLVTAVIKNWGVVYSLAPVISVLLVVTIATLWAVAKLQHRLWVHVRKFLLYAFSDPATYAHKYDECRSIYQQVHKRVSAGLMSLCTKLDDDGCVVVVAHSLGAHVLSNHIWDAQLPLRSNDDVAQAALLESDDYRCIQRIVRVFTAGSNITLFVAGLPEVQPFAKPREDFKWHNFYDEDDVLGWPLQQLPPKDGKSYADLVKVEYRINVGGLSKSWNPRSHTEYFGGGTPFIKHLAKEIEELHPRKSEKKAA